jgi:hypothetical protein
MPPARPLRDVFTDLVGDAGAAGVPAGDPGQVLAEAGHPDLPPGLVAEAVVSYADSAPPAVAEHLAPFVIAHSPIPVAADEPEPDPAGWLDLLATAPDGGAGIDVAAETGPAPDDLADPGNMPDEPNPAVPAHPADGSAALGPDPFDMDFGHGAAFGAPAVSGTGPELAGHGQEPGFGTGGPADGDLGWVGDRADASAAPVELHGHLDQDTHLDRDTHLDGDSHLDDPDTHLGAGAGHPDPAQHTGDDLAG